MKNLDLAVSKTFPRIPDIKFAVEKNGELEMFLTCKELYSWVLECLDSEVYESWAALETFERRSYDGHDNWFYDWTYEELKDFLYEQGWNLTRSVTV